MNVSSRLRSCACVCRSSEADRRRVGRAVLVSFVVIALLLGAR